MEEKNKGYAFVLLFVTFFIWGSVYVGGKFLIQDLSPALLACLRCVTAMIPLLFMARKYLDTKIDREDWKYFFLVGSSGYFLTIFLIQVGISLTGSAMASLINSLTPVSVTVLAALILKERITPIKIACIALALAGTVIITQGADSQSEALGVIVVLISVIAWGVASVYMRHLTAKYPSVLVTTYSMAISLLFHIPVGVASAATRSVHFSPKVVLVILYLGFFGSGLAQYTWTKCLSLLPASTCSLFYPLQPVFSALLGAAILKETFDHSFFIGLMLISLDILLSTIESRKVNDPTTTSPKLKQND